MNLRRLLMNATVTVATVAGVTLVSDRALILLNYPSEHPATAVHPPNYVGQVTNIEFRASFSTNSQGLRNSEIPLKKRSDEFRILMAGDSFVQGIGVEMEETIPAFLERELDSSGKNIQVINGGLAGTNAFDYGRLIFHILSVYEVDALIVSLFANDIASTAEAVEPEAIYPVAKERWGFDRLIHALYPRIYILVQQAMGVGKAGGHSKPVRDVRGTNKLESVAYEAAERGIDQAAVSAWQARVVAWLATLSPAERDGVLRGEFAWNILSYGLARPDYWSAGIDIDTPRAKKGWAATARVLEEIVRGLRARGKEVAVIYIPSKFQYEPASHAPTNAWRVGGAEIRPHWLDAELEVDRQLRDFAHRSRVPLLNLTAAMRRAVADGVALNWRHDEHLNAAGNHFVATTVAAWLREMQVFEGLE